MGSGGTGTDYEFAAGDCVRVDLDLETAKLMQDGHGGWNEAMTDVNTLLVPCVLQTHTCKDETRC